MTLCLVDDGDPTEYPRLYHVLRTKSNRKFRKAMKLHRLMPSPMPIYVRTRFEDEGWWPASYAVYAVERGGLFLVKWSNL